MACQVRCVMHSFESSQDDVALWPASHLTAAMRAGALRPLEVAEACLRRVSERNGVLNAVVTLNPNFLEEAEALDKRAAPHGLLYGLPVGIKDTTPVAKLRTTFGSTTLKEFVPARDALVVKRLRDAGALILGKTNTPEFAVGGTTDNDVFGPTRNPWNAALTCGGSTGGGAAALASGMVALADGSDLGGSLRIPASFCGVVGLRPSPGLVPMVPSPLLWDSLSVAGGIGRTAEDVALYLQATHGPTPDSPMGQSGQERDILGGMRRAPVRDLRLAYCNDVAGIGVENDIGAACLQASLELAANGNTVEEIDFDLRRVRPAFDTLRAYQLCAMHKERLNRLDLLGTNLSSNLRAALKVTTRELAQAERVRTWLWIRFRHFFRRHDFLLTPCAPIPPFSVDQPHPTHIAGRPLATYYEWFASTYVLSVAGLPVASVPVGLDRNGLPIGLQVVGPPQGEEGVLAIAAALQRCCPIDPIE